MKKLGRLLTAYVGKPRLPLTELDDKSAAFIKDTLKNYQIDLPL